MTGPDPHPPEILDVLRRRGPQTRIAVVGASNDPSKYGNIIVRNLAGKGYTVLPVNPRDQTVAGLTAYRTLSDVPGPIDIVDFVTRPAVTLSVLDEVERLGLPNVWLQDGSYDGEVLERIRNAPFRTMYQGCIMVASNSF